MLTQCAVNCALHCSTALPTPAGEHGWWDESASVWLAGGWHQLRLEFFNGGGEGGELCGFA